MTPLSQSHNTIRCLGVSSKGENLGEPFNIPSPYFMENCVKLVVIGEEAFI